MESKKIHIFSCKNVKCIIGPANSFNSCQIVRKKHSNVVINMQLKKILICTFLYGKK